MLREAELNESNESCRRLAELEQSYRNVQDELSTLKLNNCQILNELEDNYRLICAKKDFEIDILRVKIDELTQELLQDTVDNHHHRHHRNSYHNQQSFR